MKSLMKQYNIDKIDLLKMDIEGSEFTVIPNIFADGIFPDQICLELHERFYPHPIQQFKKFLSLMEDNGYILVHTSKHIEEFTFIRC